MGGKCTVIDRRGQVPSNMYLSREKFKERHRALISDTVADYLATGSVNADDKPRDHYFELTLEEYRLYNTNSNFDTIFLGNTRYRKGDKIPKDTSGEGEPGQQGEGLDDFIFSMNEDEVKRFLFDDLVLPGVVKKNNGKIKETVREHAGFVPVGNPSALSIIRSFKNSLGRNIAMQSCFDEIIEEAKRNGASDSEIQELLDLKTAIPFMDDGDLRFKHSAERSKPHTSIVMICLMDVSGSMSAVIKHLAKKLYKLMSMFLNYKYGVNVEVVFIRYHETASECDENDFFYKRETGGTTASEGLKLAKEVIGRYDVDNTNIYVMHCSDGDTFDKYDAKESAKILSTILPVITHYFYLQIEEDARFRYADDLYTVFKSSHTLSKRKVDVDNDAVLVFRQLLGKKGGV